MQMHRTALMSLAIVAASLALAGCKKNDPNPATAPEPMAAPAPAPSSLPSGTSAPAVSVQSVTIGTSVGADNTVHAQSVVTSRDPIVVSINTEGTASNVPVTARLTYQDGQVAGEESVHLNTSGPDVTHITFRNANAWPAGKYNVHVTVDGRTVGLAQQIEVR